MENAFAWDDAMLCVYVLLWASFALAYFTQRFESNDAKQQQ